MSPKSPWRLLTAVLLAFALVAAACGDDEDDAPAAEAPAPAAPAEEAAEEPMEEPEEPAEEPMDEPEEPMEEPAEESMDEPAEEPMDETDSMMADESMDPVKIGLIAQVEELMAFPEVPAVIQAYVDYFNTEHGGANGNPLELVVCGAGDAVESHIACANEFVNADDVHVVINGGFLSNSIVSGTILAEAGVANLGLGNDFIDYLTPNLYNFDPGLPGLAQVFFVFAKAQRDVSTMSLFLADDPAIAPFEPALYAIAESNGIAITETIYLGFEPDLTGPVSAAETANDGWLFVLADGAQCTAAATGAVTVGYGGHIFGNDLCLSQDLVESGAVDGWAGPIVSSAPTIDGGAEVDEINRVLDTYGGAGVQTAGLAGWALAQAYIARDILIEGGGADATDESVLAALSTYSSSDIPAYPDVSCPGPDPWAGACNTSPLMVTVVDGQMTAPDGFTFLDFSELNFLLG
ncbi:MAG: ABC transporter substrate-binding protein [bacterium]|nr:ABC transporter substrate-binding protein [bacterium]